MSKTNGDHPPKFNRWQGRIPITIALVLSTGLLMLVTVGGVLGLGAWTAQKNTVDLLGKNAHQAVSSSSNKITAYLKPAEAQAKFIADWIGRKEISPTKEGEFEKVLTAALAAAPQIEALLFIDADLQSYGAGHQDGKLVVNRFNFTNDPHIVKAMDDVSRKEGWGPPIWRPKFNKTYLNYAYPIKIDGRFIGAMVAVVSIKELSQFVSQSGLIAEGHHFLLYGKDQILAHWILENGYTDRSEKFPLPSLKKFSDPILSTIWNTDKRYDLEIPLPKGTQGHVLEVFNEQYVFIYQNLNGFGSKPIIAGAYYRGADVNGELERLVTSIIAGFLALMASLIIVIFIGQRIASPIVRFSKVANRIRDLDIAKVGYLPGSVFRELNDQSTAFNSMLQALHWFELYVPKKIVETLLKRNTRLGEDISELHDITVMFTDIVGFTATSEGMTAGEVATYVNEHFTLVASCIEKEEGTVDKFIGDSVMAFWGAPDIQQDNAERACRAALEMQSKIHTDNLTRIENGKPPIHIRIGIHTGAAIIGNIGSPGRLNYTVIGETVNVAQRLEQLAKEVSTPGGEVSILISEHTARGLSDDYNTVSLGQFALKGFTDKLNVFKL